MPVSRATRDDRVHVDVVGLALAEHAAGRMEEDVGVGLRMARTIRSVISARGRSKCECTATPTTSSAASVVVVDVERAVALGC